MQMNISERLRHVHVLTHKLSYSVI